MKLLMYVGAALTILGALTIGPYIYSEHEVTKLLEQEVRVPASDILPPVELGEVWGPDQERIANLIAKDSVESAKRNRQDTLMRRDAHPKHHGCARATLRLDNSQLPEAFRVGLFSGQWTEKNAWVRFSNGSPGGVNADDRDADVRGMAIKVLDVPGTPLGNQDLVLMSSHRFFSKDAEDYIRLIQSLSGGKLSLISYAALHPRNLSVILSARASYNNPLLIEYGSAVPYKLGAASMRFRMVPCSTSAARNIPLSKSEKNAMHVDLKNAVQAGESCFDFQVQLNQDPKRNPIEDPRLTWSEGKSPYYKVGSLIIQQDSNFGNYGQFCENISFNPWNSLPEQRPLGQINRIRLVAYKAMSKFRHEANQAPLIEPVDMHPCDNPNTSDICKSKEH